jgi:hypothetical protein
MVLLIGLFLLLDGWAAGERYVGHARADVIWTSRAACAAAVLL